VATLFLAIIYLSFISLGLPDSLLGVAWPVMQLDIKAPFEAAGLVSMTIAGSTIISSLASGIVIKRLGTGKVVFISCLMTASSLLGFSFAPSMFWLIFLAVPLGLGAGSVDSALNNYVATHYKASHMSWLHCFWGVGATTGPIIMSQFISKQNSWRSGYMTVSIIQFILTLILFFTLPLWKHGGENIKNSQVDFIVEKDVRSTLPIENIDEVKPLQIKGVKLALASFLFYCSAELTMGLWGSSYLVSIKQIPVAIAAQWVSLYYAGITIGRLITGFITMKVSNTMLIRIGQVIALAGATLLLLPLPTVFSLIGFIMVGLGFAPVFPCMVHETPTRFGKEHSQKIIGYQMACAYTGSTFLPPLLGLLATHLTMIILPFFMCVCIITMFACSEKINILKKLKNETNRNGA